jgi:hypothetical protein
MRMSVFSLLACVAVVAAIGVGAALLVVFLRRPPR